MTVTNTNECDPVLTTLTCPDQLIVGFLLIKSHTQVQSVISITISLLGILNCYGNGGDTDVHSHYCPCIVSSGCTAFSSSNEDDFTWKLKQWLHL